MQELIMIGVGVLGFVSIACAMVLDKKLAAVTAERDGALAEARCSKAANADLARTVAACRRRLEESVRRGSAESKKLAAVTAAVVEANDRGWKPAATAALLGVVAEVRTPRNVVAFEKGGE